MTLGEAMCPSQQPLVTLSRKFESLVLSTAFTEGSNGG